MPVKSTRSTASALQLIEQSADRVHDLLHDGQQSNRLAVGHLDVLPELRRGENLGMPLVDTARLYTKLWTTTAEVGVGLSLKMTRMPSVPTPTRRRVCSSSWRRDGLDDAVEGTVTVGSVTVMLPRVWRISRNPRRCQRIRGGDTRA